MTEIRRTTFEELYRAEGFQELVDEYIGETANKNIGDPKAQFDRYRMLEYGGSLYCIGAFDEGRPVGVAAIQVSYSQHYPFPIAAVESFYLRKAWRKGRTGLRLLREIKALTRQLGAPGCVFMAPPDSSLDKLCSRLGMSNTHKAYWCKCHE